MNKPAAWRKRLLGWLLLAALLPACMPRLPDSTPTTCPRTPALPPSLSKPVPPETYSEDAPKRIEGWTVELKSSATK